MTGQCKRLLAILAVLAAVEMSCSNSPTGPTYNPTIPNDLVSAVTNTFFPLVQGTTHSYEGQTADGLETITVEVLGTKVVNGVETREVRDRVYLDGVLVEDTYDWYAQDGSGNVWYLGEDTKEYENGQVVSTAGSWTWGVSGALPGIIMWADPAAHLDKKYRQEYLKGEAEDWAKVVSTNQSVTVPHDSFTGCIVTEDWTDLQAIPHENKTYCPQVGHVLETQLDGSERIELVDVTP